MTPRKLHDTRELLDPSLSALLQETYADDPALHPSPGRTERIMRTVKRANRPRGNQIWASFAWGFGATATAAVIVALILNLGMPHGPTHLVDSRDDGAPPQSITEAEKSRTPNWLAWLPPQHPPTNEGPVIDALPERSGPSLTSIPDISQGSRSVPQNPNNTTDKGTNAPSHTEIVMAAALYDVATTAYQYGDYETAYAAFEESYAALPTPEAILGTGNALMRMAQEALTPVTSDI